MIFEAHSFQSLLAAQRQRGCQVMGPTIREGAIVYDALSRVEDLPIGWTEVQDGGTYRLTRRADNALFGYVVGPHSWKQFLHPPQLHLWQAKRQAHGFQIVDAPPEIPIYAFLGGRACELHAMAIQDKVFLAGAHIDPTYAVRRELAFVEGGIFETGVGLSALVAAAVPQVIAQVRQELMVLTARSSPICSAVAEPAGPAR